MKPDWTTGKDGKTDSSVKFTELVCVVTWLIFSSSHDLINGSNESVARVIVAQLAHVHNMAPAEEGEDGV